MNASAAHVSAKGLVCGGSKLTLSASRLVPAEHDPLLPQRLPDQIPSRGWDVVVQRAVDQGQLGLDLAGAREAVVVLAEPERGAVEVGRKVGDCGRDARVQSAAVGKMSP